MVVHKPATHEEPGDHPRIVYENVLRKSMKRKRFYWLNDQTAGARRHCITTRRALTRARTDGELNNAENEQHAQHDATEMKPQYRKTRKSLKNFIGH